MDGPGIALEDSQERAGGDVGLWTAQGCKAGTQAGADGEVDHLLSEPETAAAVEQSDRVRHLCVSESSLGSCQHQIADHLTVNTASAGAASGTLRSQYPERMRSALLVRSSRHNLRRSAVHLSGATPGPPRAFNPANSVGGVGIRGRHDQL